MWVKLSNNMVASTAHRDSEIINELISRVTHGYDSTNSPYGLIKHQRTAVTVDSSIRQPKQPIGTQKSSTNCNHGRHMDSTTQTTLRDSENINELLSRGLIDSTAQTAHRNSEITNELLSRVTHGFDSPNSP